MKISTKLMFCFFLLCFILPFIASAQAVDKPKYVGFNEGQQIVWNTVFDKDPLENYAEDLGFVTDDQIEIVVDNIWDPLEWDDDVVAWKVIVDAIGEEKDDNYDGEVGNEKDVNYVKIEFSIYETEDKSDANAWDAVDNFERYKFWEAEEKVYADIALGVYTRSIGLYIWTTDVIQKPEWPLFVVPKNLHWDDIVEEVDTYLEDHNDDDHYSVGTAKVDYFFQKKGVGLRMNAESSGNIEEFDSIIKYTNDGILYYYEWSYDGDTIAKFELDTIGGVYIIENWWWIALIAGAVIVGVIIIVVVIAMKRR